MNFGSIAPGESVFVDANVFVYDFGPDPTFGPFCRGLLKRIEQGDLQGFTSAHVLGEVAYRLLTLEACQAFGLPYAGIGRWLQRHPDEIRKLPRSRTALDKIVMMQLRVLSVTLQNVLTAGDLSRQHGVLSNDALILAVMSEHGLTHLASNDEDFDRVPGITRYAPV
jgi:predicted nucleic acid-binding protein